MKARVLPTSQTPKGLDPSRIFDDPTKDFFRQWYATLAGKQALKGDINAQLDKLGRDAAAEMSKLGAGVQDVRDFWALWGNYMGSGIPPELADQWHANSLVFLKAQVGSSNKAAAELAEKANAWLRSTSPIVYLYIGGDPEKIAPAALKKFRADVATNFGDDAGRADKAIAALRRMKGLGNHELLVRMVVRLYLAQAAAPRNPASSYSRPDDGAEPADALYSKGP